LIESEEKHRILFVNSPDAYQIIIDGVFADCNHATERMFCCDRSQIIGQTPAVLSPEYQPDGRKSSEAAQEKIREALRSGKNTFEWLHRRFDGSDFMVEVSIASMVLNEKPILFSICRDITERKQAEDALQQSNQKLEAIISASPDGIGMVSLDGKFQLISEKLIEMYGYSIEQKEELLRRNVFDFIDPSNHKMLTDNIGKLLTGEKDNKLTEYVAIKEDNSRFDIEMNSTILFDSKGNPDSFLFVERNITERKNVETLLKASEIRFKTIFNEAPLGIALIDSLTGQIIEVNPMFTIVAGRTMEELANINWMSFTHPDDIQKDLDNMVLLNAGKISGFQMEKRYLLLDGTSVWINMTIASIYVEDKAHPRHLCMIENIADRKYAEEALRTSENHLNTLIQTIPDLIWLKDKNGVYLSCNKMFERFFGAKVPDIIGKTDYDFVSKELADFFRENDCKAMDAGKPNSNEEWITFADDGHRALLDTTKAPMYDSKGAIIGVLGIGHDITDRKRSEEALRESEEKLRILFDTMPNGFYRSTPEGYYVDVNPAMVKMLGYDSKEELLKAYIPTDIYVQPSERDEFQKQNIEFINKLEEYRLKTRDGRIIYIEDNARYIKDDQGEIIFHEGICRDITERKLAEEKLKANEAILKNLNADKDRFISILAHDLKSPFSTILGFLELLTENIREYDIDKIETHIGIISRAAQNTFNLLEDILVWAKSQSGKIPYRPKKLNPADIFADVVLNMNLIADAKNISINHFIAEGLTVYADIDMLKTILRNLISNAIKFTNNGGKIDIRIEQSGANITFSVSDNGVGIAPELVNKLFDITQTYTTKGTANESGTGLGLMLCKDFVEKHGGTLWVESEVGKGSKFIFSLKKYDDLLLS
jgi:PAS domain S-box-containing protein